MLEIGTKDMRVHVRQTGGDMRDLIDCRTLLPTRRDALQKKYRDQRSRQQKMNPWKTMCGRHQPTS
jgi:hypothetical protein